MAVMPPAMAVVVMVIVGRGDDAGDDGAGDHAGGVVAMSQP